MEIHHLLDDINQLRTKALQDALELVLNDKWQYDWYDYLEEKCNKGWQDNKYKQAYLRICETGKDNYNCRDMDISLINDIIQQKKIVPLSSKTKNKFIKTIYDRNNKSHITYSEESEEYYLQALISLSNLKDLIGEFRINETEVPAEKRMEFFGNYSQRIASLREQIVDDLLSSLSEEKEMANKIKSIKSSDDQYQSYMKYWKYYMDKDQLENRKLALTQKFIKKASDSGIPFAIINDAMLQCDNNDFDGAIQKMEQLFVLRKSYDYLESKKVIYIINKYLKTGKEITESMEKMINIIKEQGFKVSIDSQGHYIVKK